MDHHHPHRDGPDLSGLETLGYVGEDKTQNQIADQNVAANKNDENKVVDGGGGGFNGGGEGDSGFGVVKARGSIAERRAAKCGFHAERISVPRFRSSNGAVLASPGLRSPYLTISPGISPTALLDSPVFLPNSQPSPTTGTYIFHGHEGSPLNALNQRDGYSGGNDVDSSFTLNSHRELHSLPSFSSINSQVSSPLEHAQRDGTDCQALDSVEPPIGFEPSKEVRLTCGATESITDIKVSPDLSSKRSSPEKEHRNTEDVARIDHLVKGDKRVADPPAGVVRTSEDGYNWRKYGQKQVKGSEYPRSYYKCTHPNCQVKKKVERSHDGQITEIIYKGVHSHPQPQPSRRSPFRSTFSFDESEAGEASGKYVNIESTNMQSGFNKDINQGLERMSSISGLTDLSDPSLLTTTRRPNFEPLEGPELSSAINAGGQDDDDRATHGSTSKDDDCADDEESESKRRRTENCLNDTSLASSRAVREPRVIVQIESEIDILDDGYRWRKYGQKVVKGNPNPRSYYKCTTAGCPVRKHVERASHNLKCVITTYEGKHNHEVPSTRNNSHVNMSLGGNLSTPGAASSTPPTLRAFSTNPRSSKPESPMEDVTRRFNREPNFNSEFHLRPGFLGGNFGNDMKFSASPLYKMNFPPFQNTLLYGSFPLNSNRVAAAHQVNQISSAMPDFPTSLPLSLPTSADIPLDGFEFSRWGKRIGPVPSFHLGQQLNANDMKFLRPKQEQREDDPYEACLPIMGHPNASSSSSVYHHVMGNFPP